MCMKQASTMVSPLILGLYHLAMDIDVYLHLLIEGLKELQIDVDTYDHSGKKTFWMCATLFWTINDFLRYAMLSGWSAKGFIGCQSYHKEICSF